MFSSSQLKKIITGISRYDLRPDIYGPAPTTEVAE